MEGLREEGLRPVLVLVLVLVRVALELLILRWVGVGGFRGEVVREVVVLLLLVILVTREAARGRRTRVLGGESAVELSKASLAECRNFSKRSPKLGGAFASNVELVSTAS